MSYLKSASLALVLSLVAWPLSLSAETKTSVPDPKTSTLAPFIPTPNAQTMGIKTFYVYSDKQMPGNHFIPSGWMGDTQDVALDDQNRTNPHSGKTCIKITYSTHNPAEKGWAGMYWQSPANNWGDKKGGFNLKSYRQVTFWARGAKGGETVSLIKIGGITGTHGDTASVESGPILLTKDWAPYTIDLKGQDLSNVIGGFSWSASRDDNPDGMTFYLDDIRYE